jgi:dCTP deaminase-like protein
LIAPQNPRYRGFAGHGAGGRVRVLLTGEQIKRARLIQNEHDLSYRAMSYDVRIGGIVTPGGKVEESYEVPPQGIVEVFSEERICLPPEIAGIALVKTSLCNEGLLALNIGIIDPGWQGKVSSFLTNFSKIGYLLAKGDVFLRLTFYQLSESSGKLVHSINYPDDKYIAEKTQCGVAIFGFLSKHSSYF